MRSWILQGQRIGTPIVFERRDDAEFAADGMLIDIWDKPCIGQCGRTDGVEVHRTDTRTCYLWGDGYVAEVILGEVQ